MGTPLSSSSVASTYQALLKTSNNAALSAVATRRISDGLGNDTTIYIGINDINNRGGGNQQQNTAFGEGALIANTTGVVNVAIGNGALSSITTQSGNTAVGVQSQDLASGEYNTSVGYQSLQGCTGSNNTAIGDGATCGSGSNNIIIGKQSTAQNFSGCLVIGTSVQATQNNHFVIGTISNPIGTIVSESTTPTVGWNVRVNGANYRIPLIPV